MEAEPSLVTFISSVDITILNIRNVQIYAIILRTGTAYITTCEVHQIVLLDFVCLGVII